MYFTGPVYSLFYWLWASWRQQDLSWMPRPEGAPHAVADGPSADRVLIIGSGVVGTELCGEIVDAFPKKQVSS